MLKLGIMQPYFFPYLGYFDLINQTGRWIVFDTPQYIYHGWVNRNRILHPNTGWQYVNVPVQKKFRNRSNICDVEIVEGGEWKQRILGQLEHYKKKAPFYQNTRALVEDSLDETATHIVPVNVRTLDHVCRHLGIPFDYEIFSAMDLALGPVDGPGDWALRICEALGATEYLNPPGGEPLFDAEKFEASGITLKVQEFPAFEYDCGRSEFIPNLSIIDVLMWNSPETVRAYLDTRKGTA